MKDARPEVGVCPVCHSKFTHKHRAQGGGKRAIYCSAKCRSLDWVRGHAGSRRASIVAYESRPENKGRKRERNKLYKFAKYGVTHGWVQGQLARQHGQCACCLTPIDMKTLCVDHDHTTGRVRGLLCASCNWALGHAKDNEATLRRMMAHLSYDHTRMNVYITGALKNARVPEVGNLVRAAGYIAMDEWFTPGEFADTNWQNYEKLRGRSYAEALRGRAATNIFLFDRAHLDHADAVILLMPAGKSAMLELGYAAGRGKRTAIMLDGAEPDRYDVMPAFAGAILHDEEEMMDWLAHVSKEVMP